MADYVPLIVAVLMIISAAGGFLLRRAITDERGREKVTEYSSLAAAVAQMKGAGVTIEEVEELRRYLNSREGARTRAAAAQQEIKDVLDEFPEDEPLTQIEMNEHAARELQTVEDQLNAVIDQLSTHLSSQEFAELKVAQDKWLAFRDAHAVFVSRLFEGGSMQPLWHITTITSATSDRLGELQAYLEVRANS